MKDIEHHAKAMLLRARRQAEALLAAAQAEGEQLRAAAKVEGLAEGRREGAAAGRAEGAEAGRREALAKQGEQLKVALAAFANAAAGLDQHRRALEAEGLQEVVKLAIAIAR